MSRFSTCLARLVAAALLAVTLSACAAYQRAQVQDKEDLLAAAGFVQRPADTPQRQAALNSLPPHRFQRRVEDGKVTYLYADPTICNCLYVGTQEAYGRYRAIVVQRQIASDRVMAAQEDEMAAMQWSWGPWGGPGFWY